MDKIEFGDKGRRDVYKRVWDFWGMDNQNRLAIEELSGLTAVLAQVGTVREDRPALVDELADAIIMCEQMVLLFDDSLEMDVKRRIGDKVAVLENWLESLRSIRKDWSRPITGTPHVTWPKGDK